MASHMKIEVGAIVALDHNYAQICPIRVMKVHRDPHATLLAAINAQPKRNARNKSFISNMITEQGETLEEDDLVEYYSQWCDKKFSSDRKDIKFSDKEIVRNRASTSFSFEYDSYEVTNGDSFSNLGLRPGSVPPPESMNNLNLLANCGIEQNSKDGFHTFESNPSASPHSSKDSGDFDDSKTENDYQVLAAANALLQLSGNEKSNEANSTSPDGRKRRFSPFEDMVNEDTSEPKLAHTMFNQPGPSSYHSYKSIGASHANMYAMRANQIKNNYLYGFHKNDKDNKRKKKKRKYKKAVKGQGTLDDDDSLDGELNFPSITFVPCSSFAAAHDRWGQALPNNVLVNIFHYVVQDSDPLPFLCRASKVCKLWYSAATDKLLWKHVDLSGERIRKFKKHFIWLCKNRLSHTHTLNLANWETITGKDIQVLAKHCNKLHNICLSRCSKLNSSALRGLIESCTDLRDIDLSYTSTVITSRYMLEYLLEARGPQLTSLNLATNILVKFDIVLQSIMEKCAMLEVLDLSNVVFSNCLLPLQVEALQAGCPRLRVLLLTNSLFKVKRASSEEEAASVQGFAELEELSVARSTANRISKFRYINDEVLARMLKSSSKLQMLDIAGCRHVTCSGLHSLPVNNLTALNLSHCPLVNASNVQHNIDKWKHSLVKLDLGGNSLSADFLQQVLEKCSQLDTLTLTGCRGLPWHVRREYQRDTLPDLRASLLNWHQDEQDEQDTEEEADST